jgi:hypothetical protein
MTCVGACVFLQRSLKLRYVYLNGPIEWTESLPSPVDLQSLGVLSLVAKEFRFTKKLEEASVPPCQTFKSSQFHTTSLV